jgi:hypothetical protein
MGGEQLPDLLTTLDCQDLGMYQFQMMQKFASTISRNRHNDQRHGFHTEPPGRIAEAQKDADSADSTAGMGFAAHAINDANWGNEPLGKAKE